ncbi:hypothetical protein AVEN_206997-1, partial [Araneus ventricosus]
HPLFCGQLLLPVGIQPRPQLLSHLALLAAHEHHEQDQDDQENELDGFVNDDHSPDVEPRVVSVGWHPDCERGGVGRKREWCIRKHWEHGVRSRSKLGLLDSLCV